MILSRLKATASAVAAVVVELVAGAVADRVTVLLDNRDPCRRGGHTPAALLGGTPESRMKLSWVVPVSVYRTGGIESGVRLCSICKQLYYQHPEPK